MFANPNNVLINDGTFISYGNLGKKGFEHLREGIAPGAFHNSAERYDPPKCHPQTRLAVLKAIMDWIEDGQKTSFFMWLYGPAGAGKSAIAQTIAEMCHDLGILVASFFWSRSAPGRNNEERLIASLAYQLILAIPGMRVHVETALEKDSSLLSRSLETQMASLIVKPLNTTFVAGPGVLSDVGTPKLIILDGLDECDNPDAQRYILAVLSAAVHKCAIPLIFLIASRPEQEIRDAFNAQPTLSLTSRLALDDYYRPDEDIRLFLVDTFSSLRESHTLGSILPPTWPTTEEVETLVRKSSGQFIYAATVVKFVRSPRNRPDEQLNIILGITVAAHHSPFAELDALYRHIFSRVQDLPRAFEIISYRFLNPRYHLAADVFEGIFCYKPGDLQLILSDLHSVIDVPDIGDRRNFHIFHASLQDFLMDPARSGDLWIDEGKAHARIVQCYLQRSRKDLPRYEDDYHRHMSSSLLLHCSKSSPTKGMLQELFDFDCTAWVKMGYTSAATSRGKVCKEILGLFTWFYQQEPTVKKYFGAEMSLYDHHSRPRHAAINTELRQLIYPYIKTEIGRNHITAMTHPWFIQDMDRAAILRVLLYNPPKLKSGPALNLPESLFFDPSETMRHILPLQHFLRDHDRAGKCFVDGEMYACLSLQIGKFVFEQSRTPQSENIPNPYKLEGSEFEKHKRKEEKNRERSLRWSMKCLPFYLSNANYTSKLADYLRSHKLSVEVGTSSPA